MQQVQFDLPGGTFHALEGPPGDRLRTPYGSAARPGEAGTCDRRLLFLHGFPDHPPTGRPFFDELAARGHHVLAPWMRGYAPSPRDGAFDIPSLADDVVALIDEWSPDSPVDIVGHDWGAIITYFVCAFAPERIRCAVTMAVPHPHTFARQLREPAQIAKSWYMAFFQLPGASFLASRGDFALIDRLWRAWSPGFALPAADRRALHSTLAESMPAPLEYYREARRHPRRWLPREMPMITSPLLQLHGARDGCVLPPSFDDGFRYGAPREVDVLPGLGHFLHLEEPSRVADRIAAFLI